MMFLVFEGFFNIILEVYGYGCLVLVFESYLVINFIVNNGKDVFLSLFFDI